MKRSEPQGAIQIWLVAGLVTLILILGACSDEGRARVGDAVDNVSTRQPADTEADPAPVEQEPDETAPAEPPPETTAVSETETRPETAPAEPTPDDDGLSTGTWIVVLLVGLGALALLIAAIAAGRRQAEVKAEARAAHHRQLGEVVGRSRWLHDSGSVEVLLATDHEQLTRAWTDVRTQMIDLESRISTLAATSRNGNLIRDLRYLGQVVSDLRTAEEGYVTTQLRAQGDRRELTRTSTQTVRDRRQQLQAAIEPIAAALRPQA